MLTALGKSTWSSQGAIKTSFPATHQWWIACSCLWGVGSIACSCFQGSPWARYGSEFSGWKYWAWCWNFTVDWVSSTGDWGSVMGLVAVVLSPLLGVGVKVLRQQRIRYRLPSDCLGWRWLAIGAVALFFIWPALWQLSAIFARVVLLPFL